MRAWTLSAGFDMLGPMVDRQERWNQRYAASQRVWSAGPNVWVEQLVGSLPPGRAVDLGAGEGRHAIWLAQRGWDVTAVDFSHVGIARGQGLLAHAREESAVPGSVTWVVDDAVTWQPGEPADLVLVAYLHLPQDVLSRAATWLAPGGSLVVVGHALRNLTEGVGGPTDPALLQTPQRLLAVADAASLSVEVCREATRESDQGTSIDVMLVARRTA